jgi:hypothetical protein
MAEQRLSRLQKWILKTTYQKTINKTLPDGWRNPQALKYDGKFTKKHMTIYWQAIYRPEILANYFDLPFVEWAESKHLKGPWASLFSMVGDDKKNHNKAHVTTWRSLKNMLKKKLIKKRGDGFALTKAGEKKANELLKAALTKDLK